MYESSISHLWMKMKRKASLQSPACREYYVKRCGCIGLERGAILIASIDGRKSPHLFLVGEERRC